MKHNKLLLTPTTRYSYKIHSSTGSSLDPSNTVAFSTMSILSNLGAVVAVIAIAIGSIATYKPELFFKIPNGFILWAMTGEVMNHVVLLLNSFLTNQQLTQIHLHLFI